MKSHAPNAFIAILSVLALAGCAAQDGYKQAFDPGQAIEGSSQTFAQPQAAVWPASLATLAHQGFTISTSDPSSGIISAQKLMQDASDSGLSYHIEATITVTEPDEPRAKTQVSLAANEQTVRHQKYHTWWHLLWIVPLFPTGTEYNTVVRAERTVSDPAFYADFFGGLQAALKPEPNTASN